MSQQMTSCQLCWIAIPSSDCFLLELITRWEALGEEWDGTAAHWGVGGWVCAHRSQWTNTWERSPLSKKALLHIYTKLNSLMTRPWFGGETLLPSAKCEAAARAHAPFPIADLWSHCCSYSTVQQPAICLLGSSSSQLGANLELASSPLQEMYSLRTTGSVVSGASMTITSIILASLLLYPLYFHKTQISNFSPMQLCQ